MAGRDPPKIRYSFSSSTRDDLSVQFLQYRRYNCFPLTQHLSSFSSGRKPTLLSYSLNTITSIKADSHLGLFYHLFPYTGLFHFPYPLALLQKFDIKWIVVSFIAFAISKTTLLKAM